MAKINQLGMSYRRQQPSVRRSTINTQPLARGLGDLSESYAYRVALHNDARVQRDKEELLRAEYEYKDWQNNYITNMNSPAALKEKFGGTVFDSSVDSYIANSRGMESSMFQVDAKNAAGTIGSFISNESNRKMFLSSMAMGMEDVEAVYNKQAQGFFQQDAADIFFKRLDIIAKDPKMGPHSQEYKDAASYAMEMGFNGPDAVKAYEAQSELQMAYAKSSQETAYRRAIKDNIYGYTDKDGNVVTGVDLSSISEEELDAVAVGAKLKLLHGDFLTPEEKKVIRTSVMLEVNTLNDAVLKVKDGAEQEFLDAHTNEVVQLMTYMDMNPDTNYNSWIEAVNKKVKELTSSIGRPIGLVETGVNEIPEVWIDNPESKEIVSLIKLLQTSVKGQDSKDPKYVEGTIIATNMIYNMELTASEVDESLNQMLRNDSISLSTFTSKFSANAELRKKPAFKDAQKLYSDLIDDNPDMSPNRRLEISARYQEVIEKSAGFNQQENYQKYVSINNAYYGEETVNKSVQAHITDGQELLYGYSIRNRDGQILPDGDFFKMVQAGQSQGFEGLETKTPVQLNNYNTTVGRAFESMMTSSENPPFNMDELMSVETLMGDDWLLAGAFLSGPKGNTYVAMPMKDQEGAPPGYVRAKVYEPRANNKFMSRNTVTFEEVDDKPEYFLVATSTDDAYVDSDYDDRTVFHGVTRHVVYRGNTGLMIPVTSDPASLIEGEINVRY